MGITLTEADIGKKFKTAGGETVVLELSAASGAHKWRSSQGWFYHSNGKGSLLPSKCHLVERLDAGEWRMKTLDELRAAGHKVDSRQCDVTIHKMFFNYSWRLEELNKCNSAAEHRDEILKRASGGQCEDYFTIWAEHGFTRAPLPTAIDRLRERGAPPPLPACATRRPQLGQRSRSCECGAWATSMPQSCSPWCPNYVPMFKTDDVVAMEISYAKPAVAPTCYTDADRQQMGYEIDRGRR